MAGNPNFFRFFIHGHESLHGQADDWTMRANCRTDDIAALSPERDPFYRPEGERGDDRRRRDRLAKDICKVCPVINECLDYALSAKEPYGVWGGLTEEERRGLLARRAG